MEEEIKKKPAGGQAFLIVARLYRMLGKRQKLSFVAVAVIMLMSAGLAQVVPLIVGILTDDVLGSSKISFLNIIPYLLFILAASVLNETIKVVRRLIVEDTCTRIEKNARVDAVRALLRAPLAYFRENMRGNIHGMLNRSLDGTTKVLKLLFMDFCPSIFNSAAAVIVVFVKLPLILALVMILVVPVGILVVMRQIKTQKGIRVELVHSKAGMDGTAVELLNGVETVRICDSVEQECERFADTSEMLRRKEMKHHKSMAFYDCLKFVNEAVFTVLVIGLSVYMAATHTISVGEVLTAYLCFTQLTSPLGELHRILDELSESLVLTDQYFRIVDIPEDFSYQVPVLAQEEKSSRKELPLLDAEHISFAYPEAPEQVVLKDFSLQVRRGEFVGIAGPSGCGKSSLMKVFSKLEQLQQGKVFLEGRDLEGLSRKDIRNTIFMVPQSPFLIAGTVYDNITYGLDHKPELSEVMEAARRACIHEEIQRMPGQYQAVLAEGGGNLSGGQRQRIALARIFLQRPRLLILDEATAALDNTSERIVQAEVEKLIQEEGTAVISIAHRLSTLKNCDRILVIQQGQVVQQGKYEELTACPGIFRDMYLGVLK